MGSNRYTNANQNPVRRIDANTDRHSNSHPISDLNLNPDSDRHSSPHPNTNPTSDADSNSHPNSHPTSDADSHSDRGAATGILRILHRRWAGRRDIDHDSRWSRDAHRRWA